MSTRSLISIKNEDGTYDAVYCHFDGYPDGVGYKLNTHYTCPVKIRDLISRGAMSMLASEVSDCEFYTARGEPINNIYDISIERLADRASHMGCEYLYRFVDGQWTHNTVE